MFDGLKKNDRTKRLVQIKELTNLQCAAVVCKLSEVQRGSLLLCQPSLMDFNDIFSLEKALEQGLKSRQPVQDIRLLH